MPDEMGLALPLLPWLVHRGPSLTANEIRRTKSEGRNRMNRQICASWRTAYKLIAGRHRRAASSLPEDVVVFASALRGPRGGRADAAAYEPIVKAAMDGLTDAGIWPDDFGVVSLVFLRPTKSYAQTAPRPGEVELALAVVDLQEAGLFLHQQFTLG